MNVGMFGGLAVAVWAPQQAPAHARQPVVQVGFGAEMMVMRRIPSKMRCNDRGISLGSGCRMRRVS